jgi:CHAT domain-containing protein
LGGAINTTAGTLDSSSNSGDGGAIALRAATNIQTGQINSSGTNNAGEIRLESGGNITTLGILNSLGDTGGNITLNAERNITTLTNILSSGVNGNGGDITLSSRNGAINTTAGSLNSSSGNGDGGAIALTAFDNIQAGQINSQGNNNGGEIRLESGENITTLETLNSLGNTGGNISLNAEGNLTTYWIDTTGNLNGGKIELQSGGDITAGLLRSGFLDSNSPGSLSNGTGGDITLNAAGNISLGVINTFGNLNGGKISLTSGGDITRGILSSSSNGNGGEIAIQAAGNITTNSILSGGGNGNGGNISVDSRGFINITDDSISNLGAISSASGNGNGGNITLNAGSSINTGSLPIVSTGAVGNGGNITLNAASGDIEVAGIQAEGGTSGTGGTVDITTTSFFRATGSFPNLNGTTASISTSGVTGGGAIVIRHGGRGVTPFIVGDAGTNGTAGAITTGNLFSVQTLSPRASFLYTYEQGGIQIISVPDSSSPGPPTNPDSNTNSPPIIPGSTRPSNSPTIPQDTLAKLIGAIAGVQTSVNQDPLTGNSSYSWSIPGEGSIDTGNIRIQNALAQPNLNNAVSQIEEAFQEEYEDYLGDKLPNEKVTVEGIRTVLKTINTETGTHPVVIYALTMPEQLELVMVMPEGPPIRKVVPQANAIALRKTLAEFRSAVIDVGDSRGYKAPAQKLYQWMIAPVEPQLKALGIDTLIFCMDAGLRQIPMAALHDGKQFLVEKYSLGSIPSVSLTNSRYKTVKDAQLLGMGASKFQELPPLPAVPMELQLITQQLWAGESFLNEQFTLDNLKAQRQGKPFKIIHLATHADFQAGDAKKSYIQLWDSQVRIDQLGQMGWYQPPQVELLVLSACRTAVGDEKAELGFAGLAVQAGVKSALASLWYVSDEGTPALMSQFYQHLSQLDVTTKAEALRRAQIAMLRGQVRLENGQLRGVDKLGEISLPRELAAGGDHDFSHPYYWAGFTMIGSPW